VEELEKVVATKEQKLKHRGLTLFQEVRHHKVVIDGPVKLLQIMRLVFKHEIRVLAFVTLCSMIAKFLIKNMSKSSLFIIYMCSSVED
jgi:hypothetical protein